MHVKSFRVQNFRRLKNVRIDLDKEATIFVGANNSGKTSATHVFQRFLGSGQGFQIHDFSADCWATFNSINLDASNAGCDLPKIIFDLWFDVDDANLHRVERLLPDLQWNGEPVGVRMVYEAVDPAGLVQHYKEALQRVQLPEDTPSEEGPAEEKPTSGRQWPQDLTDYLDRRLGREYEIKYYLLDDHRCDDLVPQPGYEPLSLGGKSAGKSLVNSLIKVDFLHAQRHLTDSESRGRSEDLSSRFGRLYEKNLRDPQVDAHAISAVVDVEATLNEHYGQTLGPVVSGVNAFGYPGSDNAGLVVRASLNPRALLANSTQVHYELSAGIGEEATERPIYLPDQYNGLGFKNLIYMHVDITDFHLSWMASDDEIPPVHLVMIEEPESHLHAQLQQVFIRNVFARLPKAHAGFHTQLAITTHSPHILYERSFEAIRYFCRSKQPGAAQSSEVKDLSSFHGSEDETKKFIQRYLKLTHCDLFFADAVILVEGNVERLLLPLIIERSKSGLGACHLTILEVNGAFAHKFQDLLEFLEIPALAITDLDSVRAGAPVAVDDEDDEGQSGGTVCRTTVNAAVTSNETLKKWLPKARTVAELLDLPETEKVVDLGANARTDIRVAYQTRVKASWRGTEEERAGRTLEEAFALQNLDWIQEEAQQDLGLRIAKAGTLPLDDLHWRIFKRVRRLDKTSFALHLISAPVNSWEPPQYIVDGLAWLCGRLSVAGPEGCAVPASEDHQ